MCKVARIKSFEFTFCYNSINDRLSMCDEAIVSTLLRHSVPFMLNMTPLSRVPPILVLALFINTIIVLYEPIFYGELIPLLFDSPLFDFKNVVLYLCLDSYLCYTVTCNNKYITHYKYKKFNSFFYSVSFSLFT